MGIISALGCAGKSSKDYVVAKETLIHRIDGNINQTILEQTSEVISKAQLTGKNVDILLDTGGGDFDASIGIYKLITDSRVFVRCYVEKKAYSGGFLILQACHQRIIHWSAVLMIHKPIIIITEPTIFRIDDMLLALEKLRLVYDIIVATSCKRMNINNDEFRVKTKHDWFMDAAEAIEVGAVDSWW